MHPAFVISKSLKNLRKQLFTTGSVSLDYKKELNGNCNCPIMYLSMMGSQNGIDRNLNDVNNDRD